jgi:hypothetical protein
MSQLVALIVAAIITAGSTQVVFGSSGGSSSGWNASKSQYGCPPSHYGKHCSQVTHPMGSHARGSHNSHTGNTSHGSHDSHR